MAVRDEFDNMAIYSELNKIFFELNKMFESKLGNKVDLTNLVFTLQRKNKTVGSFSYKRFKDDNENFRHEISLNPEYFMVKPKIEILRTLCQELLLLYRVEHIGTKNDFGLTGIYDEEWASLMVSVGLMPSHTGRPDGKMTGKKVSSYILPQGQFLKFANKLSENNSLIDWYDSFPAKYEINDMLLDLYNLNEIVGFDRIHKELIDVPLLKFKGINAAELLECMDRDENTKTLELDFERVKTISPVLSILNDQELSDEDDDESIDQLDSKAESKGSRKAKTLLCKTTGLKEPKPKDEKTKSFEYSCSCGFKIKSMDDNLDITCNKCNTKYKRKLKKIDLALQSNS